MLFVQVAYFNRTSAKDSDLQNVKHDWCTEFGRDRDGTGMNLF